jgi:predicted nucleic acid-binding protein
VTSLLVVDASVALKWVLPEEDSELAEELLERGGPLHAPAFIFVELANAIWFKMRAGTLDLAEARGCLQDLREAPLQLWAGEEPLPSALEWAHRLDHAVYDCAYLALALHLGGSYVTADRRFWQKARARADLREQVMLLTDLELSPPG